MSLLKIKDVLISKTTSIEALYVLLTLLLYVLSKFTNAIGGLGGENVKISKFIRTILWKLTRAVSKNGGPIEKIPP